MMTLVATSDNSPSQNHSIVITMLTNSIYTLMSEWVTHLQVGKKSFQVKRKQPKRYGGWRAAQNSDSTFRVSYSQGSAR